VTDNTAHIQQMATALAIVASSPVTTEEEIGPKGAHQEDMFAEPSTEAVVLTIAAADEPVSIDDGDADPESVTVIIGETILGHGEPDKSVADTHGDTLDPAEIVDPAPNVTDDDLGTEAQASPERIEPTLPPATATDIFKGFPAAPHQPGEFQVPLCDLVIGNTSDGGIYDFDAGAAESLRHAVQAPQTIAPVVVTKSGDTWHVTDGWARVEAFRAQFGSTANVMVRVIEWNGTRDEALYNRFAATFLTLKSRKIDKSILLRQFHLAWNVPQLVLAARIGWTESRVTRELAAAEVMLEAPRFAELHVKAGDPPIDYLYKVQQARSDAAADDTAHPKRAPEKAAVAKLDAKLEALLTKPERFATAEALAKLGIDKSGKARAASAKSEPADAPTAVPTPEVIDCVEDSSGDAVALIEVGADQLLNIRLLVDMTTLEDRRKAEVRHLVHEAVDRLLGF
jgi:hypothetical protein